MEFSPDQFMWQLEILSSGWSPCGPWIGYILSDAVLCSPLEQLALSLSFLVCVGGGGREERERGS